MLNINSDTFQLPIFQRRHMKRILSTTLKVLLVVLLTTSTVYAGGNVKLSGGFRAGSLHFDGIMTGLGGYKDGVTVELIGIGIPVVTCTDEDGLTTQGVNPSTVSGEGEVFVATTLILKNGKSPVAVEVANGEPEDFQLTSTQGGCHDDDCSATVTEILWTKAILKVYKGEGTAGPLLLKQTYACDPSKQSGSSVSCTLVSQKSYH
jgi:hypothetical protein